MSGLIASYFSAQSRIHRQFAAGILRRLLKHAGPKPACKIKNGLQSMSNRSVRFGYDEQRKLYFAFEGDEKIYFSERLRGFDLYSRGIQRRGDWLCWSYGIDKVKFGAGDVVIDCGANFADLYIGLRKAEPSIRYISVEPSRREFECIKLNAPGQEHHNVALTDKSGTADFYISSEGGDSSLFKTRKAVTDVVKIDTMSFDDLARDIEKIKLFKLEAEGAEPEILSGAKGSLKKIEYIAVDGGRERGLSKESTIEQLSNVLIREGFELIYIDLPTGWGRALFRNTRV
jgi:FkbM family methyltransferase